MFLQFVLAIQVFATMAMVGVIWFVQHVHYPMFAEVGRAEFPHYEAVHQRLVSHVVMPLMLAEAATATVLPWLVDAPATRYAAWAGLALVGCIWASTFFWQVPLHEQLSNAFSPEAHRALVQSNWLRTIAWTTRGLLVILMFWLEARVSA